MHQIKQIITLHQESDLSTRKISLALNIPVSTISDYIRRFQTSGLTLIHLDKLTEQEIRNRLFGHPPVRNNSRKIQPDYANIHKELKQKHVTRQLLWEEYHEQHPEGYGYSQFCEKYAVWKKTLDITMRQVHKAGEKMFVDYSGLTVDIINASTGEIQPAQIFVACLGASGYTYADAYPSQKKEDFVKAHVDSFGFFKGVTEILVPDNLRSAVTKSDRYEPRINETYQDMASHYGAVVIPARPVHPKDKAKVELSVKLVQRWILAKLRKRQFFSIQELSQAIAPLLIQLNRKKIRKLNMSREELYQELDQPALKPLPNQPYVWRDHKECRVNIDYHIQLEKCFYSVPYKLVGKSVTICFTGTAVEIYYNNRRVAVHNRITRPGSYSTLSEHMPSAHRAYSGWSPSRLISWGESFGPNTRQLIEEILENRPHPEMGFRSCMGILNAARKQESIIVEAASGQMLSMGVYKVEHFKALVKHRPWLQNRQLTIDIPEVDHDNVRGKSYYE